MVDVTQTEIAMITRTALVRFQNDACSCFDQIIWHLANVNNQSFGLDSNLGRFLQDATYYIKTGMGVSDKGYNHTRERSTWGTG